MSRFVFTNQLFTPTSISQCRLWLDASDTSSVTTSGSTVTQWRDKSGNANNSTSVLNTPTWSATLIGGRPGIFLSSNAVRGAFGTTIGGTDLYSFMVTTPLTTSGGYPRFLGLDDGVNSEANSPQCIAAFVRPGIDGMACDRTQRVSVGFTYNVPSLVCSYNQFSTINIAANGSASFATTNSGVTSNFAITKWNIGCETNGSLQWNPQFYMGEVLVFAKAMSVAERQQIEGYLAWKWGIQSKLPANHPWKLFPPPP